MVYKLVDFCTGKILRKYKAKFRSKPRQPWIMKKHAVELKLG